MKKYSLIYADPPWAFKNKSTRAAATDHYPTMSIDDLKALPVNEIAADNAVLFMWFTGPMAKEATDVIEAWGFKLKTTKAFTWIKLNKRYQDILAKSLLVDKLSIDEALQKASFFGLGNYTRANSEDCLIAVKGKGLERISKAVSQVVYAPIGEHSEKPEEVRKRIEVLYGDVPRVELFARGNAIGWHCWGNECVSDIELSEVTNNGNS